LQAVICGKVFIRKGLTVKNFIPKELAGSSEQEAATVLRQGKGLRLAFADSQPFFDPYFYFRRLEGVKAQFSLERNRQYW
jgi:hypothetical protein